MDDKARLSTYTLIPSRWTHGASFGEYSMCGRHSSRTVAGCYILRRIGSVATRAREPRRTGRQKRLTNDMPRLDSFWLRTAEAVSAEQTEAKLP